MIPVASRHVSDKFLRDLHAMSRRVGIDGHYILEVWSSETGVRPLNPEDMGLPYFGPAAVMVETIAQQVDPNVFRSYGLEERLPYLESLLRQQRATNGGKSPDRPEVLYAINFVPARVQEAGGNPPGRTLIVARGGQFWADNPAFHADAAPEGITIDTLGKVLARKRASDPLIRELLHRYSVLNLSPYPVHGVGWGALAVGAGLALGFGYYLFKA